MSHINAKNTRWIQGQLILDSSHGEAVQAEKLYAVGFVDTTVTLQHSRKEALFHKQQIGNFEVDEVFMTGSVGCSPVSSSQLVQHMNGVEVLTIKMADYESLLILRMI